MRLAVFSLTSSISAAMALRMFSSLSMTDGTSSLGARGELCLRTSDGSGMGVDAGGSRKEIDAGASGAESASPETNGAGAGMESGNRVLAYVCQEREDGEATPCSAAVWTRVAGGSGG